MRGVAGRGQAPVEGQGEGEEEEEEEEDDAAGGSLPLRGRGWCGHGGWAGWGLGQQGGACVEVEGKEGTPRQGREGRSRRILCACVCCGRHGSGEPAASGGA